MNFVDYEVDNQWLFRTLVFPVTISGSPCPPEGKQMELLTWEAFSLLTGKHIDLKKRIGQKIRVFRDGGNVYVSDHSWVLFQNYKKDNIRAQCAHIGGATGEALLNNLRSRLNVIVGTEPLAWTIE